MASSLRVSLYERTASTTGTSGNVPLVTPVTHEQIAQEAPALAHAARYTIILVLSLLILHKSFYSAKTWKTAALREQYLRPTQVPYLTPLLGNAFSFLYAPQELARSISWVNPATHVTPFGDALITDNAVVRDSASLASSV